MHDAQSPWVRPAIVLFAHGARNPEWAVPFQRMRERVRDSRPETRVELAFLELMQPALPETLDVLAGEGFNRISIVPCFMAPGGHLRNDLPRLVEDFQVRHAGVRIGVTPPIGELDCLIDAVASFAIESSDRLAATGD